MLSQKKVPKNLQKLVTEKDFLKANTYGYDKSIFSAFSSLCYLALKFVIFSVNVLPKLWNWCGTFLDKTESSSLEIYHSLLFFLLGYVLLTLVDLPFSLYMTFVIEEKHGFNKQTISLYFSDLAKTTLLVTIIGLPLLSGFISIVRYFGEKFVFYVWMFMFSVQILMILIYPSFIQPLFNKYENLEDGSLREKICALCKSVQFPLTKIFVVDGSKRSSHSNAYFFGFHKNKRIVLFDTLLKTLEEDEICAVLAHELGHYKHNHMMQMLIISQLHSFCLFYLFSYFLNDIRLYESFGFSDRPVIIGFLLFQYIYNPIEFVLSFFVNSFSRKNEFQADRFASQMGHEANLKSSLIKIHKENLGNLNPDKLYSKWYYSHPPLVERLDALKN